MEDSEPRRMRLFDLAPHEVVVVRCRCGRMCEYVSGFLQRRHRLPSDLLVYDLQFRLRCTFCRRRAGFRISVIDGRSRGDNRLSQDERVVVEMPP